MVAKRLLLFTLFTLFIFLVFELVLRFKIFNPEYQSVDAWWRWRWYTDRKALSASPAERSVEFHPVLGWVPKPNTHITIDQGKKITINSAGFRTTKEYSQLKQRDRRITMLGDSFSFGDCVGDDDTYSSFLEKILSSTEVLNFGVQGYGIDQMLLRLPYALSFNPDVVIVSFINDDLPRVMLSFRDYQKPKFIFTNGKLTLTNTPLVPPNKLSQPLHILTFDALETFFSIVVQKTYAHEQYIEEYVLTRAIFEEMIKTVQNTHAKFYILYLPGGYQEVVDGISEPDRVFSEICSKASVTCLDPTREIYSYISTINNPQFHFQCHYSKEVHEVIGKYLSRELSI